MTDFNQITNQYINNEISYSTFIDLHKFYNKPFELSDLILFGFKPKHLLGYFRKDESITTFEYKGLTYLEIDHKTKGILGCIMPKTINDFIVFCNTIEFKLEK